MSMAEIILKDGGILKNAVIPKEVTVRVKGKGVTIVGCEFKQREEEYVWVVGPSKGY